MSPQPKKNIKTKFCFSPFTMDVASCVYQELVSRQVSCYKRTHVAARTARSLIFSEAAFPAGSSYPLSGLYFKGIKESHIAKRKLKWWELG